MRSIASARHQREVIVPAQFPGLEQLSTAATAGRDLDQLPDVGVAHQQLERVRKTEHIDTRIGPARACSPDQRRAEQNIAELRRGDDENPTERLYLHGRDSW